MYDFSLICERAIFVTLDSLRPRLRLGWSSNDDSDKSVAILLMTSDMLRRPTVTSHYTRCYSHMVCVVLPLAFNKWFQYAHVIVSCFVDIMVIINHMGAFTVDRAAASYLNVFVHYSQSGIKARPPIFVFRPGGTIPFKTLLSRFCGWLSERRSVWFVRESLNSDVTLAVTAQSISIFARRLIRRLILEAQLNSNFLLL